MRFLTAATIGGTGSDRLSCDGAWDSFVINQSSPISSINRDANMVFWWGLTRRNVAKDACVLLVLGNVLICLAGSHAVHLEYANPTNKDDVMVDDRETNILSVHPYSPRNGATKSKRLNPNIRLGSEGLLGADRSTTPPEGRLAGFEKIAINDALRADITKDSSAKLRGLA